METKQYAAAGPWISVEEALPEATVKPVLVKYASGNVGVMRAGQVHVHTVIRGHLLGDDEYYVTHWAEVRV